VSIARGVRGPTFPRQSLGLCGCRTLRFVKGADLDLRLSGFQPNAFTSLAKSNKQLTLARVRLESGRDQKLANSSNNQKRIGWEAISSKGVYYAENSALLQKSQQPYQGCALAT